MLLPCRSRLRLARFGNIAGRAQKLAVATVMARNGPTATVCTACPPGKPHPLSSLKSHRRGVAWRSVAWTERPCDRRSIPHLGKQGREEPRMEVQGR